MVGDSPLCAQELDIAHLAISLGQQPEAFSQELETHAINSKPTLLE